MKIVAKKRNLLGKKSKQLAKNSEIASVVYGPKRKSANIKVNSLDFSKVFKDSGYSKIIDFELEGKKKKSRVIIREVQHDPVTDEVIHISFYELDLSKPITTEVPVKTKGKSRAVEESIGFLVTPFEYLEVRCLPEKLPEKLVVDISNLNEIGDNVPISELDLPERVELTSEVDEHATLAYIAPPQKEIVEEEPEEEVEEVEGEEGEEKEGEEEEEKEEKEEKEEGEIEEGKREEGAEKIEEAEERKE
jgi:large subunit ribosomal protein L25